MIINKKHDEILRIYEQKLKYFHYTKRTIEIYLHYVSKFVNTVDKYYQHLVSSDFQSYLDNYKFSSISQQKGVNEIRSLFVEGINNLLNLQGIARSHDRVKG